MHKVTDGGCGTVRSGVTAPALLALTVNLNHTRYSRICMAGKPATLKIASLLVPLSPLRHESNKTLLEGHHTVNKLAKAAARDKTEICKK